MVQRLYSGLSVSGAGEEASHHRAVGRALDKQTGSLKTRMCVDSTLTFMSPQDPHKDLTSWTVLAGAGSTPGAFLCLKLG